MIPIVMAVIEGIIGGVVGGVVEDAISSRLNRQRSYFKRKGSKPSRPQPTPNNRSPLPSPTLQGNRKEALDAHNASDKIARDYHTNYFVPHQDIISKSPFLSMQYRSVALKEEERAFMHRNHALNVERTKAENKRIDLSHGKHPSRVSANTAFNAKRPPKGKGDKTPFGGLDLDASTLIGGALFGTALDILSEYDFSDVDLPQDALKTIGDFKNLITNFSTDDGIFKKAYKHLFDSATQA